MITTKSGIRMVLAAALLVAAACGKKDDATPLQPALTPPGATEKVPAQAEVKASSGPIELTFLLYKTQIKAGESLWQQLRIRNIGNQRIFVTDSVFQDLDELRKQSQSGYGIYLEGLDPDGKPLKVQSPRSAERESHIAEGVSGLLEVDGPKEQAMLDGWKKQGLNSHAINLKLMDFNTKKQQAAERGKQLPDIELQPGQSAETKSWFFYSMQDKLNHRPIPRPIGDFAQLNFFAFEKIGKYKVRAVYDRLQSELARKAGIPIYPHNVLIRTSWISIEVLP